MSLKDHYTKMKEFGFNDEEKIHELLTWHDNGASVTTNIQELDNEQDYTVESMSTDKELLSDKDEHSTHHDEQTIPEQLHVEEQEGEKSSLYTQNEVGISEEENYKKKKDGYMNAKRVFEQQIHTELKNAEVHLKELKTKEEDAGNTRSRYVKQVDELQGQIDLLKDKVEGLGEATGDVWERLKGGVESAWSSLSTAVKKAATNKTE